MTPRDLAERPGGPKMLTPQQVDHLIRALRVFARAEEVIGSEEEAGRWMYEPNRALQGKSPFDLLHSDAGIRKVEQILGRMELGPGA